MHIVNIIIKSYTFTLEALNVVGCHISFLINKYNEIKSIAILMHNGCFISKIRLITNNTRHSYLGNLLWTLPLEIYTT